MKILGYAHDSEFNGTIRLVGPLADGADFLMAAIPERASVETFTQIGMPLTVICDQDL
jgi:hypothetical protein